MTRRKSRLHPPSNRPGSSALPRRGRCRRASRSLPCSSETSPPAWSNCCFRPAMKRSRRQVAVLGKINRAGHVHAHVRDRVRRSAWRPAPRRECPARWPFRRSSLPRRSACSVLHSISSPFFTRPKSLSGSAANSSKQRAAREAQVPDQRRGTADMLRRRRAARI